MFEVIDESEVADDLEDTSLFDQLIFTLVILVLIVGDLYLFQKT